MRNESGFSHLKLQRLAIKFIPYSLGMRLMAFIFSQSWLHTTKFRKQWNLFKRLIATCPTENPHKEFKTFLTRIYFRVWLIGSFAKISDRKLEKIVKFNGLDEVIKLNKSGHGIVLLNSNIGPCRLLAGILSRKNIDFISLEAGQLMQASGTNKDIDIKILGKGNNFLLRQLFEADKALKTGRIVQSTGDGHEGNHSLERNFLGQPRHFQTSLLEIAIKRKALVIPVFVIFENKNSIRIDFHPEMATENAGNVDSLLDGYISLLEKYWLKYPGQVSYSQVKRFFVREKEC